jgi:hypothetical protein
MFSALFDFVFGFAIGRGIANSGRIARDARLAAERAAWSEERKIAFAKRQEFLAGERRFVYVVFIVLIGTVWAVGALIGG